MVSRRGLFKSSFIGAAAMAANGQMLFASGDTKQHLLIGGYKRGDRNLPWLERGENALCVCDLKSGKEQLIPVFGDVHSVLSIDKRTFATFPKFQDTLSIVDIQRQEEIQRIACEKGYVFTGHGAYDPKSHLLYCAEMHWHTRAGRISLRKVENGSVVHQFATLSPDPHELYLNGGDGSLIVANGDVRNSLSSHDLRTGKVIKDLLSEQPEHRIRHFVRIDESRYVVASWTAEDNEYRSPASLILFDFNSSYFWSCPSLSNHRLIVLSNQRMAGLLS
jgi:hypothetical protein